MNSEDIEEIAEGIRGQNEDAFVAGTIENPVIYVQATNGFYKLTVTEIDEGDFEAAADVD
jgi:hypothetical protein